MHTSAKLGAVAALGLCLLPAPASAAPDAVELTPMPNGSHGSPLDVNDHDVIVGIGNVGTTTFVRHAVRWSANGQLTDLGALPGAVYSAANAINGNGEIAGSSGSNNGDQAVKWTEDGTITALPSLPGAKFCDATDINDQGVVVGRCGDSRLAHQGRAVRWHRDGTVEDLGVLPGHIGSTAAAVNEEGAVVGSSITPGGGPRAVIWEITGSFHELASLPNGTISQAFDINDNNVVAGYVHIASHGDHAVRWNADGGALDLNQFADSPMLRSAGRALNDGNFIVGDATTTKNQYVAAAWEYTTADVLQPHHSARPGSTSTATAINISGVVVGRSADKAVRWRYY